MPGYFEIPIKKGESIIFSAGTTEASPRSLNKMYEVELASRTCRTSFYNCLKNAAKQFYIKDEDGEFIKSGYPWGPIRARDTFIALPGTTLAINHENDFHDIMATASKALNNFIAKETRGPPHRQRNTRLAHTRNRPPRCAAVGHLEHPAVCQERRR